MAFKLAAVLCLSFALLSSAQLSGLTSDLNAKENSLNCLLGKPNCVSPSPPPTTTSPPPPSPVTPPPTAPPTAPPTVPPTVPPTAPAPAPFKPEAPVPAPAFLVPTPAPAFAPVPAPSPLAPAPAPTGTAVVVISISLPNGYVLTDAQRTTLANIIQAELGSGTTVTLSVNGGRKLLELDTFTLVITGITNCPNAGTTLEEDIPTIFVQDAQADGIPVQSASLNAFACSVPGSPTFSISGPPAVSPGPSPV